MNSSICFEWYEERVLTDELVALYPSTSPEVDRIPILVKPSDYLTSIPVYPRPAKTLAIRQWLRRTDNEPMLQQWFDELIQYYQSKEVRFRVPKKVLYDRFIELIYQKAAV